MSDHSNESSHTPPKASTKQPGNKECDSALASVDVLLPQKGGENAREKGGEKDRGKVNGQGKEDGTVGGNKDKQNEKEKTGSNKTEGNKTEGKETGHTASENERSKDRSSAAVKKIQAQIARRIKAGQPVDRLQAKLAKLAYPASTVSQGEPEQADAKEHSGNTQSHPANSSKPGGQDLRQARKSALEGIGTIDFPESLPISSKREAIAQLLRENQVIILAGETGSGKTTQLPKLCLALGRGVAGRIGHTQPRRIAARSVAARISEELKVELGKEVGYQVRFTDRTAKQTLIKLMTDGVLLAEIQSDPLLSRYDTLIIDEAHERSINIDFLLGYLKDLLPKRPDLKLIVTSATIDLEKFSKHFNNAPVLEVSGRSFPVEIIYRPLDVVQDVGEVTQEGAFDSGSKARNLSANPDISKHLSNDEGLFSGVRKACDELIEFASGTEGDILVFLAGEKDIRQCADELKRLKTRSVEVLPLYSRLSTEQQNKIFKSGGLRKIILSTNVAETSLTVPGIRFVVDSGFARIKRYSVRTKIERLPIERISKASAKQRSGRCGRMRDGVCIRLFSEEDFEARPEFTEPEIQRSNLASVILQMKSFGVSDPQTFPFIDPPEARLFNDGYRLLEELKALDKKRNVTHVGRQLQKLKVDPTLGRILLEASSRGVLNEALIIVSGIASQNPKERPHGKRDAADQLHKRFDDKRSDFNSYVYLWDYLKLTQAALSRKQFDTQCRQEYLHTVRIREWRDLHRELSSQCDEEGLKSAERLPTVLPAAAVSPQTKHTKRQSRASSQGEDRPKLNTSASSSNDLENAKSANEEFNKRYEDLHASLLTGLITNCGVKVEVVDKNKGSNPQQRSFTQAKQKKTEYEGTRQRRFQIFPTSSLSRLRPRWVLAAQLLETSKLYAHDVAAIDNTWIESAAKHLLKETLFEPSYDHKRGQVIAYAKLSLYGLVINERKRVDFSQRDPKESRAIFIRDALVLGKLEHHQSYRNKTAKLPDFYQINKQHLQVIEEEQAKHRRQDIRLSDDAFIALYASRLPLDIVDKRTFDHWYKASKREADQMLTFSEQDLRTLDDGLDNRGFPDQLKFGELSLPVSYEFNPGGKNDGVNVTLPLSFLHTLNPVYGEWLVPGLLPDKILALLKTLPKSIRRKLVPLPETVAKLLPRMHACAEPIAKVLAHEASNLLALPMHLRLQESDFDDSLPDILTVNYRLTDDAGKLLGTDRDLAKLKAQFKQKVRASIEKVGERSELKNLAKWDFGSLPLETELKQGPIHIKAYPALTVSYEGRGKEQESSVDLKMLDDPAQASYESYYGQLELAYRMLDREHKLLRQKLLRGKDSPLALLKIGNRQDVVKSIILAAIWQSIMLIEDRKQRALKACPSEFDSTELIALRPLFRDEDSFKHAVKVGSAGLADCCYQYERLLLEIFPKVIELQKALKKQRNSLALAMSIGEINQQIELLFYPKFLVDVPKTVAESYPRYLNAIIARLDKAAQHPARERTQRITLDSLISRHEERLTIMGKAGYYADPLWQSYRWGIEELRVSYYAQQQKTLIPISEKRLNRLWSEIDK